MWGTPRSGFLLHARGIEHHSNGVQNVLGSINLVLAAGRIGRPHCGYGTIVGQANGQGGREHGQKCDQLPGLRDISNPDHRRYIAGVWGIEERELPGPGVDAYEMFRKIDAGEIKGLISICFNPKVSLPDNALRDAVSRQARVLRGDRFLPERHGAACRHRVARPPCTRKTKDWSRRSKAASSRSTRPWTVRATRGRTGGSSRTSRARWIGRTGSPSPNRARFSRNCGRQQGRRRRLLGRHL